MTNSDYKIQVFDHVLILCLFLKTLTLILEEGAEIMLEPDDREMCSKWLLMDMTWPLLL